LKNRYFQELYRGHFFIHKVTFHTCSQNEHKPFRQERNEGGKGWTFPRAPNHYGERQMTARGTEKS